MLLENNTERVINLIKMVDNLKGIDKIRLSIYLFENLEFISTYDANSFIKVLKRVLSILNLESKKIIVNFAKYNNLLFISSNYMELSLEEKKKFSVELLFNIFQYDFKNEEINVLINNNLSVYDYCYSLNIL